MDASRFIKNGDSYLLVVHTNITDRKLSELAAQARQDQLETILDILTHDLRNPLNIFDGYTELLGSRLDDTTEVATIRQSAQRITETTDATLEFTRSGDLTDLEPLSIGDLADRAWRRGPSSGEP